MFLIALYLSSLFANEPFRNYPLVYQIANIIPTERIQSFLKSKEEALKI